MGKMNRQLAILNLTGALLPELKEYFISRNILVVDPLINSGTADWTHIITKDIHDFNLINDTYDLTQKDRHIISLSQVSDLQNFTINNGNIILDDIWFKGNLGSFIMDKYFQGYGGITLGDNYPSFQEMGSFNVTNPFNTGEYLDRMVQKAFESGIEALTLKTYFDHLVMYVAGLKKKEKAGLPFEITYGVYEDVFALQMHFFSQRLEILDVTTGLSSIITKKADEYFLNVAVQSADFFDFSYMPEVNKVIITGLWTKDERIKFENRGLMFTALEAGRIFHKYENEGASSSLVSDNEIPDFTDKLSFSQKDELIATSTVLKGSSVQEESSAVVKGSADEAITSTVVAGSETEKETLTKVSSAEEVETEDEVRIIKGEMGLDELVNVVKSKFEEEKSVIRVSGNKLDIEKVAYRIAASVDESTKESNLKVRSLGNKIPDLIKTGLFDFAKNLNKSVDDLGDSDIDQFQIQKLPEIIRQGILKKEEKSAARENNPQDSTRIIEAKLLNATQENDKLKSQLRNLAAEVRILKESRAKVAEIQMKATKAAVEVVAQKSDDPDDELRKQFQQKINDQKLLNEMELKKLGGLLERESKLIAEVKAEEMKTRKLHIENIQKETFYSQEIEKSQRQLKAKDLMLIKTKESFTKLVEKKENEISELRQKTDQLSRTLATAPSQTQTKTIKDLEKQNANLFKQLDVYKIKLSSLASKMQTTKDDDNKDDARKLQMINNQLKNQLDMAKKESEKWQSKASQDHGQILAMKQEKVRLEQVIKKLNIESSKESSAPQQPTVNDQELKRLQAHNQILENQLKENSTKVMALESKLQEALKLQRTGQPTGDDGSKVKVTQLENSVKKLTQDIVESKGLLAEAKKETNKLRQEKTALQNMVDKLKKDAVKAKAAMPKKPNGKAA